MFTSRVEVLIARPLDEVFEFVADVRNRPSWDDSVDREELTSPEPIGVGSTVRTELRSMGKDYVYTWEIVEHSPPERMRVESTSGPFPTIRVSTTPSSTEKRRHSSRSSMFERCTSTTGTVKSSIASRIAHE